MRAGGLETKKKKAASRGGRVAIKKRRERTPVITVRPTWGGFGTS